MFNRIWVAALLGTFALACASQAAVITGAPLGSAVDLHDGTFSLDLNGDGVTDLTVSVRGIVSNGNVQGSNDWINQATNVGVFRGNWTGTAAWPLNTGEQVGPGTGGFLYSVSGLSATSEISATGEFVNSSDYSPPWGNGGHHFIGVDVPSGANHHFGWVEMSIQDSGAPTTLNPWYDLTVYGWGYDTQANETVTIPEPSALNTLATIALAAIAITRRRRLQ